MKDVQATEEASSPQKMTSSTSNNKTIHFSPFIFYCAWALIKKTLQSMIGGQFCPHLDPDPAVQNQCGSVRIWIQINNTDFVYESVQQIQETWRLLDERNMGPAKRFFTT
jgi:hypothetical protein